MPKAVPSGFAIWLTGLPSSGKTTLAHALERRLTERGIRVRIIDSDELRRGLTPHPTYSSEERDWFYGVLAAQAESLTDQGNNIIIAATAPRQAHRDVARLRIARFAEVHVDCPPAVCRARDPRGLWRRADRGEITTLPGVGVSYEPPEAPEVHVDTAHQSVEEAAHQILSALDEQGFFGSAGEATKKG